MADSWRLARSLVVLRSEIRSRWPGAVFWTIGDAAHRDDWSDHNPNAEDVVCAGDIPKGGPDLDWLANTIVATDPPALKYVIWKDRIWTPQAGWTDYHGAYHSHVHVSVGWGPDGRSTGPYDDTSPWGVARRGSLPVAGGDDVIGLKRGDEGEAVKGLQATLRYAGFDPGEVDGVYGPKTAAQVLAMRKSEGSGVDDGDNITGWAYAQLMRAISRKYGPGSGGASSKDIKAAVEAYLKANPPKDGEDGKTPTRVMLAQYADVVEVE